MSSPPLVLASSSRYRRELLERLHVPFTTATPEVDERPRTREEPSALALRLACAKAHAVRHLHPDALIIGSDQVATVGATLLDKPGTHERAAEQLRLMSEKKVEFLTALCLLNARSAREQTAIVPVTVHMRNLDDAQIERYLRAERPYDCAGSARIEGLGIALVAALEGTDPTALIGLPLIKLCDMLRAEGIQVP
jgi:septum formation protein